jgi:hypothetical protein
MNVKAVPSPARWSRMPTPIGAPNIEFTTADLTDIADALRRTGAGHGRI